MGLNIVMCTTFLQGGAGRVIYDLSRGLSSQGHRIVIFATKTTYPGYENYEEYLQGFQEQGIPVVLCDSTFKRDIYQNINASVTLRQLFSDKKIDIIHAHAAVPSMVAMIARSGLGRYIPIVQTMHGWGPNKTPEQERMDIFLLNCVDQVVAVSQGDFSLLRSFGIQPANMKVIYNGIGECHDQSSDDPVCHELLQIRERGARIVGCIGTIGPRKNQGLLIEAMKKISSDCGNVLAVFIGEGDGVPELRKRANSLGVGNQVLFTGYRKDASRLMRLMDVLVLPSVSEGLPLSLIEGMRERVLRVGSAIPGIKELITDGETGFLFSSGDADHLARLLSHVLMMDAYEKRRITERAYADFQARFTVDRMVKHYLNTYVEVLQGRGLHP
ncbi:N-acetyl-alpha-D-glucosaminyl L-malate synthase [Moorella thermoacetica]|uniref:Glycosyltransferase EpsD n=1 Tax=Neomoorella thermoacetica TaxID=1525 RepID=A0AAC9HGJ8_NEOTH|nr:glycosyltransferase family 4 protein [Moorella thermoacetica]AOQ23408.1 Putative glycosyltransferase EpsD [Moorella thermoacetica]TYL13592.1 N-acetyl-alpha-D-glucosaminyl L-malate synthase [Moorella thermoacetica]